MTSIIINSILSPEGPDRLQLVRVERAFDAWDGDDLDDLADDLESVYQSNMAYAPGFAGELARAAFAQVDWDDVAAAVFDAWA